MAVKKKATESKTRTIIQSMTGFGRGMKSSGAVTVTVDMRSTNHRYLEIDYRMPSGLNGIQGELTQMIRNTLKRGRIEVSCNLQSAKASVRQVQINEALADRYFEALTELKSRYGLGGAITIDHMLAMPQVMAASEDRVPSEELQIPVKTAAEAALKALIATKQREGKRLVLDIRSQIAEIFKHEKAIKRRLPRALKEQRTQLKSRIQSLLRPRNGVSVSQLEELLALLKDADVNEEIVRIESHLEHLQQT